MLFYYQKQRAFLPFQSKVQLWERDSLVHLQGGTNELYNSQKCGFVSDNNEEITNYIVEELSKNKENRIIKSEVCRKHVDKFSLDKQIASIKKIIKELQDDKKYG